MDFIALDLETADKANTAPCAIGLVKVSDGHITDRNYYLINPETEFNPFSVRVHKITPEMVTDAPTLPEIWLEIWDQIKGQTLAIHNASFDVNVIQKAAERYHLPLPSFQFFCTLEASKDIIPCKSYKLSEVCKQLDIPLEHHHNALADAEACAKISLRLFDMGLDVEHGYIVSVTSDDDKYKALPEFEQVILREIVCTLSQAIPPTDFLRWTKGRDKLLRVSALCDSVRIGYVRKRYFLAVSEDRLHLVDQSLEHDSVKAYHRFYLDDPMDIHKFDLLIHTTINDALTQWSEYKQQVAERTWNEHLREYKRSTNSFDVEF